MSARETGGSAFPCIPPQDTAAGCAVGYPFPDAGMTLRDYFAAKAMPAVIDMCKDDARKEGLSYPEYIAAVSYGIADAMLKARGE